MKFAKEIEQRVHAQKINIWGDGGVNYLNSRNPFMMCTYIKSLYTLNLICPLHLKKAEKRKKAASEWINNLVLPDSRVLCRNKKECTTDKHNLFSSQRVSERIWSQKVTCFMISFL